MPMRVWMPISLRVTPRNFCSQSVPRARSDVPITRWSRVVRGGWVMRGFYAWCGLAASKNAQLKICHTDGWRYEEIGSSAIDAVEIPRCTTCSLWPLRHSGSDRFRSVMCSNAPWLLGFQALRDFLGGNNQRFGHRLGLRASCITASTWIKSPRSV